MKTKPEEAKNIILDFLTFERVYKHSIQGLTREQVVDKYIKTYTKGATA